MRPMEKPNGFIRRSFNRQQRLFPAVLSVMLVNLCSAEVTSNSWQGQVLTGSVTVTAEKLKIQLRSNLECAIVCDKDSSCLAFTYNATSRLCHLTPILSVDATSVLAVTVYSRNAAETCDVGSISSVISGLATPWTYDNASVRAAIRCGAADFNASHVTVECAFKSGTWTLLGSCNPPAEGSVPASVVLQAEAGQGFEPSAVHARSEAAGLGAVWLCSAEDYVMWTFCMTSADNVTVQEVRYSMDAFLKEVAVLVDGREVGTFLAANSSNYGQNWNVFLATTHPFSAAQLQPGPHTLRVSLKVFNDTWGIEIDQVTLTFQGGLPDGQVACDTTTDSTVTAGN